MLESELKSNILVSSMELVAGKHRSVKLNRYKFYLEFLNRFPLQYQRNDKTVLSFNTFSRKVIETGICSNWKLHRKRSKNFKLVEEEKNKIRILLCK